MIRIAQGQADESRKSSDFTRPQTPPQANTTSTTGMNAPPSTKTPPMHPKKRERYYANNLTPEDKAALRAGELSHNHKVWTPEDLVAYQISRIELVPSTPQHAHIVAEILDEKKRSERFLVKSAQDVRRFVGVPLTRRQISEVVAATKTYETQNRSAGERARGDLRAVSVPNLLQTAMAPSPQEHLPVPVRDGRGGRKSTDGGLGNGGDYFSKYPGRGRASADASAYSSASSRDPSRNRPQGSRPRDRCPILRKIDCDVSPGSGYTYRADVTFDNMLSPHRSGKGEAFRGSESAKKEDEELQGFHHRLSKMPSMPHLKKKSSEMFKSGDDE